MSDGPVELRDVVVGEPVALSGRERRRIEEHGYYLDEEGTRVAVAPYLVYFDPRDLVRSVSVCERDADDEAALRACLTRQVFDLPPPSRASTPRKEDPS